MPDAANGEVGFASVEDIIVQEPDGIEMPVRQVRAFQGCQCDG